MYEGNVKYGTDILLFLQDGKAYTSKKHIKDVRKKKIAVKEGKRNASVLPSKIKNKALYTKLI